MSTIELYHGNVTCKYGSMNVWVNVRRDSKSKEISLMDAVKDPKSGVAEPGGMIESVPATKHSSGGYWNKRRVECDNGVYLRFFMRRVDKKDSFGGKPSQSMSSFFIRARDTAPLRELRIELPNDQNCSKSCLYIMGRFDMVEPEEIAEQKLYMNGDSNELQTLNPAHWEPYVEERVIEGEIAPRKKVVSQRVGKKTLKRPTRTRRIRKVTR